MLLRDIRSRRSSINRLSADTTEMSIVRYLTAWTAEQSTKVPAFPEFVASVLLLVVGLWVWPEVWSYNQFAGDCTFKYEEDWGNIIRACAAYILYYSKSVHDEMWLTRVSRWQISHVVIDNRRYSRARSESWSIACVRIVLYWIRAWWNVIDPGIQVADITCHRQPTIQWSEAENPRPP